MQLADVGSFILINSKTNLLATTLQLLLQLQIFQDIQIIAWHIINCLIENPKLDTALRKT